MKTKVLFAVSLFALALLFLCRGAKAQDAVTSAGTVEGGTIAPTRCDTTNLPRDIWSLIRYDNAGEPCTTHASQFSGSCTPNAWNWPIHGSFTFTNAPGYKKVRVEVQVWAGGCGGACYGGTADPIFCDNQYCKAMKQDGTYESDIPGTDMPVPFHSLEYLLAPYDQTPGDGNYRGLWVFAKPIGRPAICRTVSYNDSPIN